MTGPRRASRGARRRWSASLRLALALGMLTAAGDVGAESWGGLTPGETTRAGVERLYGRPSRERTLVEEGQTASEWTYAAERAPRGLDRMVISFGLLVGGRFSPDIVRAVVLYPRPHVFSMPVVASGWGTPDAIGTEEATGRPSFHYRARGLLIIFDKTQSWAEFLLFGPRQPGGGG